ncbi:DUF599 domain-containing protein [Rhodoferax sp.]|uniref:DUF599 domain-containing protein n=1 Tax=Rhodoferax sp. TaxID=50421 RepID=UPI002732070D|nr:DUF599 domain-containing protein [Rhodoferax sp.]MDP1528829.1 DUF599 domain-containing protein [Rhodoferax sp.]MDP1943686.1 DUF599 domain-containing protein [Rhodoferax sp.]MDP2440877.1 DUF599 domain-containing protein [Rhodoferax sp.]MDZ4207592.1 DUF599 domain-containing protein [Rhodoferax sp.]
MNLEQWVHQFGSDAAAFTLSCSVVALYYLWLRSKVKENPTYTIHGVNQLARSLWVANVMGNSSKDIMAVQTLRNFIMGASLMASTATLLIIGTLTLSGQAESISKNWHILNIGGTHAAELWIIKVLFLLVDFIVAFFAFVMSVRLVNQVVFMINAPGAAAHHNLAPTAVANRLNRAGNLFATGTRAFFFAVPLVFWLFGPVFLVLATLGLVVTLVQLDRTEPE